MKEFFMKHDKGESEPQEGAASQRWKTMRAGRTVNKNPKTRYTSKVMLKVEKKTKNPNQNQKTKTMKTKTKYQTRTRDEREKCQNKQKNPHRYGTQTFEHLY